MSKKATGIVAYITWIGWIIAFCAGDKEGAKFHLNQALNLWIINVASSVLSFVLGGIPVIGLIVGIVCTVVGIFTFVCWILGLINAIKEEEKPLPLIGGIALLK